MSLSIQNYLRRLRYEKHNAVNTIIAYTHDLEEFFVYLQKDIISATSDEIFDFLVYIRQNNNLDSKSIARKISCFRSFYKDLVRLQLREDNPMDLIDSPKMNQTLPSIISEEELNKIFDYLDAHLDDQNPHRYFQKIRDLVIFEVLYSCGLRVSELCDLQLSSIYLEERIIRVLGKGNKERLIPIGTNLYVLLQKYYPIRNEYLQDISCNFLITSKFKKKVSRMFIWKVLRQYSESLNVTTLHPHMLRHAFATHMLSYGADLRLIQELLGHADLSTTEIYTHVDKSSLIKTMNTYHPLRDA
ncbi:MAG: tyrosine-type recombinase/integrase [Brevinema sp.]